MLINMQRSTLIFTILAILLIIFFSLSLMFGSVLIPIHDFIDAFTGDAKSKAIEYIIFSFRLPKAITAIMAGAAIAISGLHMQTIFNNPLADTSVLGIGHGAGLGVAVFVLASFIIPGFISTDVQYSNWGIVISAIAGAGVSLMVILIISNRLTDMVSLLLAGIMVGFVTGALVCVLQYMSDPEQIKNFLVWTFGSLAGVTWSQLQIMFPIVMLGLVLSLLIPKSLNALLLGEQYATSVGVNVKYSKRIAVGITCILAGTVTAFTGPIAFIGIAVPHFCRMLFKTTDHRILIPATIICGSVLMLICDIISQVPGGQTALPINAVTCLIGAPMVLSIILKQKKQQQAFS